REGVWAVWIEQKGGLDTGSDKFLVDLVDLSDGVSYSEAIAYRVRRWSNYLNGMEALNMEPGLPGKKAPLLMADDNEGDCLLMAEALKTNHSETPLETVPSGEALLDYLYRRGKFAHSGPAPSLILLDLNMPGIGGREALKIIKSDASLRKIPVVILTSSKAKEDVSMGYESGVNSYITKPTTFGELVGVVKAIQGYWLDTVELPSETRSRNWA
ncbi:MAG TPA: response regulator, partial [bacterium]|nr:response regulator [bacterium]